MNAQPPNDDDSLEDLKILLEHLLTTPADRLASLAKAIEAHPEPYSFGHVARMISDHLALNEADSFAAADELLNLVGFVSRNAYGVEDATGWLRSVADEADLVKSEETWDTAAEHICKFLQPQGYLNLIATSRAALMNLPRLFMDVSVDSDVGAVFTDQEADVPQIGIISHRFKLQYLDGERQRSFTVTLDTGDLRKLYDAVDKVIERDRQLRLVASKGGIPCFEIG
jgi:hypothetical protein